MAREIESERDTLLPVGKSFVSDCSIEGEEMENSPKSKQVWFVLIQKQIPPPEGTYQLSRTVNSWQWAHTKSWARHLAREAQAQGFHVVDVFKSEKVHISHKYRGL